VKKRTPLCLLGFSISILCSLCIYFCCVKKRMPLCLLEFILCSSCIYLLCEEENAIVFTRILYIKLFHVVLLLLFIKFSVSRYDKYM